MLLITVHIIHEASLLQGVNGAKGDKGDSGLPGPQGPSVSHIKDIHFDLTKKPSKLKMLFSENVDTINVKMQSNLYSVTKTALFDICRSADLQDLQGPMDPQDPWWVFLTSCTYRRETSQNLIYHIVHISINGPYSQTRAI